MNFLKLVKEVVDTVSELTCIDRELISESDKIINYRKKIIKLFYKNYDFLPEEVLNGLILLDACLKNPEKGPV